MNPDLMLSAEKQILNISAQEQAELEPIAQEARTLTADIVVNTAATLRAVSANLIEGWALG